MIFSYHLDEIYEASDFIIKNLVSKTILFDGDLGSGKTTLIKSISIKIGSKDNITSPTFPIVNIYQSNNEKIYHVDLYRINNIKDLNEIGFFDIINEKTWVFVEWPKKIIEYLECPYSYIKIKVDDSKKRTIEIKNCEI
tara:strand:+ start:350 stop:766 length:417 start_codon:yes stop_codon:yes gene_type:complete